MVMVVVVVVVVVVMMMKIIMMLFQTFHIHVHVLCLAILSGLQFSLTVSLYFSKINQHVKLLFSADSTPDATIGEARMYAQGGIMCPVNSFKLYCSKLHPASQDLWQRPRESFSSNDHIWYCNAPLGKNTLSNMMANISSSAKLSKRYTNHCIRATSVSALDRAGFEARHIIRATGHKSETSIKSYSRRLTESTQREMSDALSSALSANPVVNTDVHCEQAIQLLTLMYIVNKTFFWMGLSSQLMIWIAFSLKAMNFLKSCRPLHLWLSALIYSPQLQPQTIEWIIRWMSHTWFLAHRKF